MNRLIGLIGIIACLLFTGCLGKNRKITSTDIYSDYRIWGDEEGGNVSVKLQFSLGGPDGPSILLKPPSGVEFDGELPGVDSSRFNGTYYELLKPAEDFGGKHEIIYRDDSNRVYRTAFDFPIISFKNVVPAEINRDNLVFELNGLKAGDRVRISLVDTSFPGKGLERLDTVKDGRILISRAELDSLHNGPINLSLSREEERWLTRPAPAGGHLYASYTLKREFILRDSANLLHQ